MSGQGYGQSYKVARIMMCISCYSSCCRYIPDHQRLLVHRPTIRAEVNVHHFNILEPMPLVEPMSLGARLKINWKPQLVGLPSSPINQRTACSTPLELRVCVQHVEIYVTSVRCLRYCRTADIHRCGRSPMISLFLSFMPPKNAIHASGLVPGPNSIFLLGILVSSGVL